MEQLKVLIVDDEPGIRSGIKRILGKFMTIFHHFVRPVIVWDERGNILWNFLSPGLLNVTVHPMLC